MKTRQETTLAGKRLHWGIFVPVLMMSAVMFLVTLPALYSLNSIANIFNRLNPQTLHTSYWLFPMVLVPECLFCGFLATITWIAYLKSEITLTNRRLMFRTGLLSRQSGELPLENVESIFIIEPLLGCLCGYGTVSVSSIGGRTFPLHFIGSPTAFHQLLQKAVRDAKTPSKSPPKPPPPLDDDSRYKPKM